MLERTVCVLADLALVMPLTAEPVERHARLLASAAAGDSAALGVVLREEGELLHRICTRMLGDREDGLDAFQDGCLRIQRALPSYDPARPARPWLIRMCVRSAQGLRRKRRRRRGVFALPGERTPALVDRSSPPDDGADARQLHGLLGEALAQLPPRERDAFVLRHLEGLDVADAARVLEVRPTTVRGHCLQARRKLQTFLSRRCPKLLEGDRP